LLRGSTVIARTGRISALGSSAVRWQADSKATIDSMSTDPNAAPERPSLQFAAFQSMSALPIETTLNTVDACSLAPKSPPGSHTIG
jgi:hypothetical protein